MYFKEFLSERIIFMIKRFDLSYVDILEDLKGDKLFGKGTSTINTAIRNLEEKYFEGRNVFRNNTKSSDLLFRWEIKNLLLLLIKIEIDNVFSSGKSSKEGVTDLSIKKILGSYDYINNDSNLRNYEMWVLEQSFSAVTSREFVEDIDGFEKTLTNFCVLVAKYYDMMPSDYIKRISAEINSFSRGIIDYVQKYRIIENIDFPKINIDQYHGTAMLRTAPLRINLETAVVKAINTIADALYDFDDNGCCYRKSKLNASDVFNKSYVSIHSEHMEFGSVSSLGQKEKQDDEFDCEIIRKRVDELMEDYWAEEVKIPHDDVTTNTTTTGSSFFKHNSKEKIDVAIHNLKAYTFAYIQCFCTIKLFVSGRIDRHQLEEGCSGKELFEKYEKMRAYLSSFQLLDHPFSPVLSRIEKEVWKTLEDYPDGGIPEEKSIDSIIIRFIDDYRSEIDVIREKAINEFDNIENRKFDGDILCGVKSNIDKISSDNEDIAKNILSMILKLEADKDDAIG